MNFTIKTLILAGALGGLLGLEAQASSITYTLNQSNIESVMPDGVPYVTVNIQDGLIFGTDTNAVKFTVDVINSAFTIGSNFGIQDFGFNLAAGAPTISDTNIVGPTGWTGNIAPPPNPLDGFGKFTGDISTTGSNRQDPLVFWITGVIGDTIASYTAPSTNTAIQGNAWFSAHVTGFTTSDVTITSGYFGGGNGATPPTTASPVPIPAAFWLFGSAITGLISVRRRKNM